MVCNAAKALAGIACLPGLLVAQGNSERTLYDAWYWGVNGGAMVFNSGLGEEATRVTAPAVGAEWLITRTRIALRMSVQQAFFDEQAGIFDPTAAGNVRAVDVSDWRRYAAEVYAFPTTHPGLRPYAGMGIALNVLQNATPQGSFNSEESMDSVFSLVHSTSTRASLILAAGMQADFGRSALFFQGSAMPTRNGFLLSRSHYTFVIEAGVRYNFGSAIEKF
jgi:hypothetical protein